MGKQLKPYLITHETIVSALQKDNDAIATIINHYSGMIEKLSYRCQQDERGNFNYCIDPVLKHLLESKLMYVIEKFNLNRCE